MLLVIELDRVDVFEHFLQVGLHCCWLLGLRQNFQQVIIRQEIEPCEFLTLLLQIFIE